jgi:hypothetical protein
MALQRSTLQRALFHIAARAGRCAFELQQRFKEHFGSF